jgi:REP element-mobilizing transposase RayT
MPRQARLDAPGTLHHVMIRGIEKRNIVDDNWDRTAFVSRLGDQAKKTGTSIYAWSLLKNHAHFLLRSGYSGLPKFMRRFLTGYAVGYNRRHKRFGHLFQNRYKSILCEDVRKTPISGNWSVIFTSTQSGPDWWPPYRNWIPTPGAATASYWAGGRMTGKTETMC